MDDPDDWDFDIHQQFVEAIFKEGLKKCSPSTIVKNMAVQDKEDVTLERVKSHLQKFRANRSKSLAEFMISYNNAIGRYRQSLHAAESEGNQEKKSSVEIARTFSESDPNHISSVITESDKGLLLSGEVAAFLTISSFASSSYATEASTNHATSDEGEETLLPCHEKPAIKIDELALSNPPMFMIRCTEGIGPLSVQFPALSDEEKRSPMGALLRYVMGNFMSFNEMVMKNREAISHRETLSIAHEPHHSSSVASKQSPQHQDSDSTKEGILTHQQTAKGIDQGVFIGNPNKSENPVARDDFGIYLPNSTDISKELNEGLARNIQSPLENIIHSLPTSYIHQRVKGIQQQPLSVDESNDGEYPVARDAYGIPYLPNSTDIIKEINEDLAIKGQNPLEKLTQSLSTSSATLSPRHSQRLGQPIYDNETERAPHLLLNGHLTTDKQCNELGNTTREASICTLTLSGAAPTNHEDVIHGQINEPLCGNTLDHTISDNDHHCTITNNCDNSPAQCLPNTSSSASKNSNPSTRDHRPISSYSYKDSASVNNIDFPSLSERRKRDAEEDLCKDLEKCQKKDVE